MIRGDQIVQSTVTGRPIQSMEEARDWERLFIGEIKAGRNPRHPPSRSVHVSTEIADVSAFLEAYLERCIKPAGLRSITSVRSQIAVLKEHLGDLPLSALEDPDEINRFKTGSDYAEDVELTSVHRVLEGCARPSTGGWRKRHRCSPSLRFTESAFG